MRQLSSDINQLCSNCARVQIIFTALQYPVYYLTLPHLSPRAPFLTFQRSLDSGSSHSPFIHLYPDLSLKILSPPAPVHQPDQVFRTKRNTTYVNLCVKGGGLID